MGLIVIVVLVKPAVKEIRGEGKRSAAGAHKINFDFPFLSEPSQPLLPGWKRKYMW